MGSIPEPSILSHNRSSGLRPQSFVFEVSRQASIERCETRGSAYGQVLSRKPLCPNPVSEQSEKSCMPRHLMTGRSMPWLPSLCRVERLGRPSPLMISCALVEGLGFTDSLTHGIQMNRFRDHNIGNCLGFPQ